MTIICDDGSTDGTTEYLQNYFPEVILLQGNGNLWWSAGINRCVEKALALCNDGDCILTINNDVVVSENYLEQKIQSAFLHPNSIIGSLCLFKHDPQKIETSAHIMDWEKARSYALTRFGEQLSSKHRGVVEITHICAKGVLIPCNVFKKIGLYDAEHFPQYHADTDFTLRAHKAGYKILLDYDSRILSEVNRQNIGIDRSKITIKAFVSTFRGRYSLNNYWVLKNFAEKHFSLRKRRYLAKTYFFIIGGYLKRFLSQLFTKQSDRI